MFEDIKNAKRVYIKRKKGHLVPYEVEIVQPDGSRKFIIKRDR